MSPKQATLYFAGVVDEGAFIAYCTGKLCASIVEGDPCDLRWCDDDTAVWARDVRGTLAGDFMVPGEVMERLEPAPKSAIALEIGTQRRSEYVGFLVVLVLLRRWGGCVAMAGDLLMLASNELMVTSGDYRPLRSVCGDRR
jgi:hypothetical protein